MCLRARSLSAYIHHGSDNELGLLAPPPCTLLRRADMLLYFNTLATYYAVAMPCTAAFDLFSGACCEHAQSAEGHLCVQLTSHNTTARPLFDGGVGADFF